MSASVREWDLGKVGQLSPNEREPRHEEKNKERERKLRREKAHHSRSPSPHDIPGKIYLCVPCILRGVVEDGLQRKYDKGG